MTQKPANLKQLGVLADLVLDRDLALLAKITSERKQVRAKLVDLEMDLDRLVERRTEKIKPTASFTNADDAKWQAWRRAKKNDLNTSLARIESEREIHLVKARVAFGRSQVVQELRKKENPD